MVPFENSGPGTPMRMKLSGKGMRVVTTPNPLKSCTSPTTAAASDRP